MKKILVATGTSENKKAFATDYIKTYLNGKGVVAEVISANIYEMKLDEINPDVIVTIGPANFASNIPVIDGTCFVTKFGMEPVCDKIIAALG